jgi:CheY-like chemotaxis protein
MGGILDVTSTVGDGSTFSFSIALAAAAPSATDDVRDPHDRFKGQDALIVDDNATNRRILRYELEGWGMGVSDVGSGREAIALVDSGAHFDVALVDMKMPEMNGEELAASLELSDAGKVIPLILMSAFRMQLARRDLFSSILAKPVTSTRMQDSLQHALWPGKPVGGATGETEDSSNDGGPLRLLLVEDNSVNQRVGRLILEKLGHRVDLAGNGIEAVHAVNQVPYDAVFMDIQMPEMNGFDATQQIRHAALPFHQPYVIALTANVTVEDRRKCLEAGMDEFLTKPIRLEDFESALRRTRAHAALPALIAAQP